MGKISINELAEKLTERKGLSKKEAAAFVNEMFYLIQKGMGEDSAVKVKGLGTFKLIDVDDRESINVNTGERVLIEGHRKISFIPDAMMKELVNKPFSQFETVVLNEGVDFNDIPNSEQETSEPEPEVSEPEPEVSEPEPEISVPEPETHESEPTVEMAESELQVVEPEPEDVSMTPLVDFVSDDTTEDTTNEVIDEVVENTEDHLDVIPEESEYENEDEETTGLWKKWVLTAVLCCLFFAGGYFLGQYQNDKAPETATANTVKTMPKPALQKKSEPVAEAQSEANPKVDTKAEPKAEPKVEPKAEPKVEPKAEPKAEPTSNEYEKYEQMDIRIRTGAYRIVGTDHIEKVRPNDDLSRICKRTIGPGMECYLEVYNGIKGNGDLKPGQEIKIPKLQHKKKKSK
jgi:nucleoid DNA-binding protein